MDLKIFPPYVSRDGTGEFGISYTRARERENTSERKKQEKKGSGANLEGFGNPRIYTVAKDEVPRLVNRYRPKVVSPTRPC